MTATAALELRGLSKRFGAVVAVGDADLDLHPGEHVALVGPSGCGKSTLLRLVAGLLAPDGGEIRLHGRVVEGKGVSLPPERRRVGLVFQDHALFPHLTARDNVAFGIHELSSGERDARVHTVLGMVGMDQRADRWPHELSGGEQQRIALARALAPRPDVVLLDEPFSNLDRNLRHQVRADTVAVLREAGASAIFVTHDHEEAFDVGDRVAVMRDGRIEQIGTADEIYAAPVTRFVASFMGDADFLPASGRDGRLHCELGEVSGWAPTSGEEIDILLRPHEVTFRVDAEGSGRVVARHFRGSAALYEIALASGRPVRSLQPPWIHVDPGAAVGVEIVPSYRAVTFARDATPSPPPAARPASTRPG